MLALGGTPYFPWPTAPGQCGLMPRASGPSVSLGQASKSWKLSTGAIPVALAGLQQTNSGTFSKHEHLMTFSRAYAAKLFPEQFSFCLSLAWSCDMFLLRSIVALSPAVLMEGDSPHPISGASCFSVVQGVTRPEFSYFVTVWDHTRSPPSPQSAARLSSAH